MKSFNIRATLAFLAVSAIAAVHTPAQTNIRNAPIVIQKPVTKKPDSGTWMKVQVIRVDANSMIVSEQDNERMIHTFNYSDDLKPKVQKIIDAGGYQYGDKIKVLVAPGNVVVTKINGKPSKPL